MFLLESVGDNHPCSIIYRDSNSRPDSLQLMRLFSTSQAHLIIRWEKVLAHLRWVKIYGVLLENGFSQTTPKVITSRLGILWITSGVFKSTFQDHLLHNFFFVIGQVPLGEAFITITAFFLLIEHLFEVVVKRFVQNRSLVSRISMRWVKSKF